MSKGGKVATALGAGLIAAASKGGGKFGGLLGKLGKFGGGAAVGQGGKLLGAAKGIGGLAATLGGNWLGSKVKDGKGGARDVAGGAIIGAANGAGWGATAGLLGGPLAPITAPVGAAIGGVAGGIYGGASQFIKNKTGKGLTSTIGGGISTGAKAVYDEAKKLPGQLSGVWKSVKGGASSAWQTVSTSMSTKFHQGYVAVTGIGRSIGGALGKTWGGIKSGASTTFGAVKTTIGSKLSTISETVKGKFESAKKAIQDFDFGSAARTAAGTITSVLGGLSLAGQGLKIAQSLADGITSSGAFKAVTGAAAKMAGWVKDHVPNSPAKRGPLKKFPPQRSGRLIAKYLAQGIQQGRGHVQRAAAALASDVNGQDYGATLRGAGAADRRNTSSGTRSGLSALVGGDLVLPLVQQDPVSAIRAALFELTRIKNGGVYTDV
jgi:hypothetical protein